LRKHDLQDTKQQPQPATNKFKKKNCRPEFIQVQTENRWGSRARDSWDTPQKWQKPSAQRGVHTISSHVIFFLCSGLVTLSCIFLNSHACLLVFLGGMRITLSINNSKTKPKLRRVRNQHAGKQKEAARNGLVERLSFFVCVALLFFHVSQENSHPRHKSMSLVVLIDLILTPLKHE
jgi:hypothetical protein